MEVPNEVSTGLKTSLLMFVLILVGTLVYFVIEQNEELTQIYTSQDIDTVQRTSIIKP